MLAVFSWVAVWGKSLAVGKLLTNPAYSIKEGHKSSYEISPFAVTIKYHSLFSFTMDFNASCIGIYSGVIPLFHPALALYNQYRRLVKLCVPAKGCLYVSLLYLDFQPRINTSISHASPTTENLSSPAMKEPRCSLSKSPVSPIRGWKEGTSTRVYSCALV